MLGPLLNALVHPAARIIGASEFVRGSAQVAKARMRWNLYIARPLLFAKPLFAN